MAIERTLSIIKPDATRRNLTGQINARLEAAGLRIVAQRRHAAQRAQAEAFYAVHRERPFYRSLCEFMTSGPVVVQVLEGENAVETQPRGDGRDRSGQGRAPARSARISPNRSKRIRCTAATLRITQRARSPSSSPRSTWSDERPRRPCRSATCRTVGADQRCGPDRTLPARAARSDPRGARGVPCDQACHPLPRRARAGLRRRSG